MQLPLRRIDSGRLRLKYAGWALAACLTVAVIGSGGLSQFTSGGIYRPQSLDSASRVPGWPHFAGPGPASPPVRVCGNNAILGRGPTAAPAGAVTVPAGDDAGFDWGQPRTVYWFAPGVHTLGPGEHAQITPGVGSTYIGAPGAIVDGRHTNLYAFGGHASDVTITYLTVEDFGTNGGDHNQGVVNAESGDGWTVDHSTLIDNAGAGVMLGSDNTLSYDCLKDNQQYGFDAFSLAGPANLILDHNEIVGNDTYNWESHDPGCGCSGGGKFWIVDGAVITDNWVHGNRSVGLWADTDNRGFEIKGNYIADNYADGLIYEISYNALIEDNTFVRNGLVAGPLNRGFPTSAIYISESGSDSRVPGKFGNAFLITTNTFIDNWSGVILWENSDRFCDSPANTSTGVCTLVDPKVVTVQSCNPRNLVGQPYYGNCRWKTQNVLVDHNVFDLNPADIGPSCTPVNECGFQGIFSEYGSYPSWSPYQGTAVEEHITFDQNNRFAANVYNGPWEFMAYERLNVVTWQSWHGSPYHQDPGSILSPPGD